MGCIYMRTDPNEKSYIGQTSFKEEQRWKEYCSGKAKTAGGFHWKYAE